MQEYENWVRNFLGPGIYRLEGETTLQYLFRLKLSVKIKEVFGERIPNETIVMISKAIVNRDYLGVKYERSFDGELDVVVKEVLGNLERTLPGGLKSVAVTGGYQTFKGIILTPNAPRLPYERKPETRTSIHWGQRKLLIAEISFFTSYLDPNVVENPLIVYAGAAPGTHIPILMELFPNLIFHLYDPSPFKIEKSERIQLFQEYFTDEIAVSYRDRKNVYFLSDIRSTGYRSGKAMAEVEAQIVVDLRMQEKWVEMMRPTQASLKFRLPYAGENVPVDFSYLDGVVYLQAWAPQASPETRLVPFKTGEGYAKTNWNIVKYDDQMFYHNNVERTKLQYASVLTGEPGPVAAPELMSDYDSNAEAFVLKQYAARYFPQVTDPGYPVSISEFLTKRLQEIAGNNLTLASLRASEKKTTGKVGEE